MNKKKGDFTVETGNEYQFADLEKHEDLKEEIRRLESKMQQELGQKVNLIAYSRTAEDQ
jgi:hypothetical protein